MKRLHLFKSRRHSDNASGIKPDILPPPTVPAPQSTITPPSPQPTPQSGEIQPPYISPLQPPSRSVPQQEDGYVPFVTPPRPIPSQQDTPQHSSTQNTPRSHEQHSTPSSHDTRPPSQQTPLPEGSNQSTHPVSQIVEPSPMAQTVVHNPGATKQTMPIPPIEEGRETPHSEGSRNPSQLSQQDHLPEPEPDPQSQPQSQAANSRPSSRLAGFSEVSRPGSQLAMQPELQLADERGPSKLACSSIEPYQPPVVGHVPQISAPSDMKRGIHVEFDKETGKFIGLPKMWSELGIIPPSMISDISPAVRRSQQVPEDTSHRRLISELSADRQAEFHTGGIAPIFLASDQRETANEIESLPSLNAAVRPVAPSKKQLDFMRRTSYLYISKPTDVKHKTHVRVDPSSATGFVGLPDDWSSKLTKAGIDINDVGRDTQNLDALVSIMDTFYESNADDRRPASPQGAQGQGQDQDPLLVAPGVGDKYYIPKFKTIPTEGEYRTMISGITDLFTPIRDIAALFSELVLCGRGSSGMVYVARPRETPKGPPNPLRSVVGLEPSGKIRKVAIKTVSTVNFIMDKHGNAGVGMSESEKTAKEGASMLSIKNEVAIMHSCDHPNIVKLHGIYINKTVKELYIVMDYMNAGCLTNIITKHRWIKKERVIAIIMRDVLKALKYMHDSYRIYRDLKSDNILISAELEASTGVKRAAKRYVLKLSDFGFTCQLNESRPTRNSVVGTPYWMAPELIRGMEYSIMVDSWSAGILMLEMAQSLPPFIDLPPLRAVYQIVTQPPPTLQRGDYWSPEMHDFLSRCCTKNPGAKVVDKKVTFSDDKNKRRWSCAELLDHPWIQRYASDPLYLGDYL